MKMGTSLDCVIILKIAYKPLSFSVATKIVEHVMVRRM